MISTETSVILSRACEVFILEITMRAWIVTEQNKRRTLQKMDITGATAQSDMYDFLIDLLPREGTNRKDVS